MAAKQIVATVFIDTNSLKWGICTKDEIASRSQKEQVFLLRERDAILAIIQIAKNEKIIIYTNIENKIEEMWSTNISDYKRINILLNGLTIENVEPPFSRSRVLGGMGLTKKELIRLRDNTFKSCKIKRFEEIKKAVGGNKNADAYHIYSAESAKIDYFLTLDTKLVNSVRNQTKITFLVKILFPSELLAEITQI